MLYDPTVLICDYWLPQGKGSMETYWLIGKHGKLPERRVESDKEEEIDVMAENPHTDARRKQRKAQKKKERENKEKSTLRRALDSVKEHLPKWVFFLNILLPWKYLFLHHY